jgi:hypothetical protein
VSCQSSAVSSARSPSSNRTSAAAAKATNSLHRPRVWTPQKKARRVYRPTIHKKGARSTRRRTSALSRSSLYCYMKNNRQPVS